MNRKFSPIGSNRFGNTSKQSYWYLSLGFVLLDVEYVFRCDCKNTLLIPSEHINLL